MFACFLGALISTKARGIELPNCGCFGAIFHVPLLATMIMDAFMLAAAGVSFSRGAQRLSLDNWSAEK